jgi:HTH-type transcriptional regulator/antitoxin HipB
MPRVTTAADLGMLVRARRRERALSQQELADRVGVSRQWIVAVEKGKPRAELGLLLRTLSALDLALSIDTRPDDEVDIDALIDRARGRGS